MVVGDVYVAFCTKFSNPINVHNVDLSLLYVRKHRNSFTHSKTVLLFMQRLETIGTFSTHTHTFVNTFNVIVIPKLVLCSLNRFGSVILRIIHIRNCFLKKTKLKHIHIYIIVCSLKNTKVDRLQSHVIFVMNTKSPCLQYLSLTKPNKPTWSGTVYFVWSTANAFPWKCRQITMRALSSTTGLEMSPPTDVRLKIDNRLPAHYPSHHPTERRETTFTTCISRPHALHNHREHNTILANYIIPKHCHSVWRRFANQRAHQDHASGAFACEITFRTSASKVR